jgi:hypothetical protein
MATLADSSALVCSIEHTGCVRFGTAALRRVRDDCVCEDFDCVPHSGQGRNCLVTRLTDSTRGSSSETLRYATSTNSSGDRRFARSLRLITPRTAGRSVGQRREMFEGSMRKMVDEVVGGHTHPSAPVNNEGWVGFVCQECGAPLGVHRSNNSSKPGERSTRGWRVTCTGCGVTEFYEPGTPMVRITAS